MINKRSKNINFVGLQGWMVNELNLKNNNLIVYAIIYGFSKNQDGDGFFSGSREYLASWTSSSVRGIQKNLNQLVEDGLIVKGTFNGKTVYKPNESILNLDLWTSDEYINGEQSSPYTEQMNNVPVWSEPNSFKGEQSSFSIGEQSSHNNIDIYNSNNNKDYIYRDKKETFVSVIDSYTQDEILKDALYGFVEMRQKEKGFTIRALKLNLSKLDDIALDNYTKVSVVNQSIEKGWKSFYPLKTNNRKGDDLPF